MHFFEKKIPENRLFVDNAAKNLQDEFSQVAAPSINAFAIAITCSISHYYLLTEKHPKTKRSFRGYRDRKESNSK